MKFCKVHKLIKLNLICDDESFILRENLLLHFPKNVKQSSALRIFYFFTLKGPERSDFQVFRIIVIILVLWLDAFIINGRCALQHCGTSIGNYKCCWSD